MLKPVQLILGTLLVSAVALAAAGVGPADALQVNYAGNLLAPNPPSYVNLTNTGSFNGNEPAGDICANFYVFDAKQEMLGCCACLLTPNHLQTLTVNTDLTFNNLTPETLPEASILILSSDGSSQTCDASGVTAGSLVSGIRAWGTHIHLLGTGAAATAVMTENEFLAAPLSASELAKVTSTCTFIENDASGYGICGPCRVGAQGASKAN